MASSTTNVQTSVPSANESKPTEEIKPSYCPPTPIVDTTNNIGSQIFSAYRFSIEP